MQVELPQKEKVGIRDFVRFSFFIYPLSVLILLYSEKLIKSFYNTWIFYLIIFSIFALIDWLWGRVKLKNILLTFSFLLGVGAYSLYIFYREQTYGFDLQLISALAIYLVAFPIFQIMQFAAWLPFLAKYIYQNHHNLDNLKWK